MTKDLVTLNTKGLVMDDKPQVLNSDKYLCDNTTKSYNKRTLHQRRKGNV